MTSDAQPAVQADPEPVPQGRRKARSRLWLAVSVIATIVALLMVPPLVSVRRYRSRITQVVAASLGRPVRLSSVELRMLPRPSFVLTDLVVEEDPAYGAEPVLHATTVTAAIRLLPLWSGRLQISRISVDEASLNLVRLANGHWNLDSFFRTAATRSGPAGPGPMPFPYLEATNSRINIKNGVEKLPFSLVSADLSFWQENAGDWRLRLRGQPARTDVSLDLPDTGIVRLEASLRRAPQLRQMPLHVDLDWRDAQLGQLSRLVLGSDEGWRGDLTGELHVDGTADTAQVKTRLRASGVHRAEFAPASPIDFDASCGFVYHYPDRRMENLVCDSPVGNGRAHLTGSVLRMGGPPRISLELDHVPAQIGLDALRTLRSGLDPGLEAGGAISGKISFDPAVIARDTPAPSPAGKPRTSQNPHAGAQDPLSGILTVEGLHLTGDGLTKPIQIAKVTLEPAPGQQPALAATGAISAGGTVPLTLIARLASSGYQVGIRGSAALPRLRELARLANAPGVSGLDGFEGGTATLDLTAEGPWLPAPVPLGQDLAIAGSLASRPPSVAGASDRASGTVTLQATAWKSDFLANPVQVVTSTLHLDSGSLRWDPVAFSYGPVKGTATLELPSDCEAPSECLPHFAIRFGELDAAALQAAILGAHQSGTLLSTLIARLRPSTGSIWPAIKGTVQADSLVLGPLTLSEPSATIDILPAGTKITSFGAGLFDGQLNATGTITPGQKPSYALQCQFSKMNAIEVGRLLGMNWSGNGLDGAGRIELSGFTDSDLAASAKGSFHFDWRHGSVSGLTAPEPPPALAKFDRWTGDAAIANGAITLRQNQVQRGSHKVSVEASAVLADPPTVTFAVPQADRAAKH
jgi:hypothetical protein